MIDLNQAEILANRLREKRNFWQGGSIDWDRIMRERHDMEQMFPELVSELKEARVRILKLEAALETAATCIERQPVRVVADTIWYCPDETLCEYMLSWCQH